ncbi:hypothetical protein EHS25_007038 [Saitozyma podzolica]|uniref:SMP-30/Gluconolactonase/LRE-like region domain-containing protein n=1 Tax=Saitozyma podzolica TaxID=1890683 RepID=A0A427XPV6_9TREE|nr:hypothetical protein EHS25_007038 [Saitozyma podzolica]
MAGFYPIPPTITAEALTTVPQSLWSDKKTDWMTGAGKRPPIFLEGPTTDTEGNLFVVDVPYGRILKHSLRSGSWAVLAEWDGEPNGLAVRSDGMLLVADYKEGLLLCDPNTGTISPFLTRRNLERFKGTNDLVVSSKGEIYFTDQGQTGMTDPTGHVYRLNPDGKLDTLVTNGPSPNGIVLTPDEKVLYVAMTRENSVWRLPLHADGTTTKVAKFFSGFGIVGHDGLTVDQRGNLFICHPSLVCIFVVTPHGVPLARVVPPEGHGTSITNCIFGSTDADRKRLYFTDSTVGRICYVDWDVEGGTPVRPTGRGK